MRKKQLAPRVLSQSLTPDSSFPSNQNHDSELKNDCITTADNVDSKIALAPDGSTTLSDGTPVIQPADPDTNKQSSSGVSGSVKSSKFDTLKCTACGLRVQMGVTPLKVHPVLNVIVCKACAKFYSSQTFVSDSTGKHEICRWCADGGDLICCDTCPNAFCKRCIRRNLGRSFLHSIESLGDDDMWKCFVCYRTPTLALRKQCAEVMYETQESRVVQQRRLENRQKSSDARHRAPPKPVLTPTTPIPNSSTPSASIHSTPQVTSTISSQESAINTVSKLLVDINRQAAQIRQNANNPSVLSTLTQALRQPWTSPAALPTQLTPNVLAAQPTPCNAPFPVGRPTVPSANVSSHIETSVLLDQISSVNETNIRAAIKATRRCVDSFSADLLQLESNLATATTSLALNDIVRSFQSMYRFHLIARLFNLSGRIREELPCSGLLGSGRLGSLIQHEASGSVTIDLTTDSASTDPSTCSVQAPVSDATVSATPMPDIIPDTSSEDRKETLTATVENVESPNPLSSEVEPVDLPGSPPCKRRCTDSPSSAIDVHSDVPTYNLSADSNVNQQLVNAPFSEMELNHVSSPVKDTNPELTAISPPDIQHPETITPLPESSVFLEDIRTHIGDNSLVRLDNTSNLIVNSHASRSNSATPSDASGTIDSDDALASSVSALERSLSRRNIRKKAKTTDSVKKSGRATSKSKSKPPGSKDDNEWILEDEHLSSHSDRCESLLLDQAPDEVDIDMDYREHLLRSSSEEGANELDSKSMSTNASKDQEKPPSSAHSQPPSIYTRSQRALLRALPNDSDDEAKNSCRITRSKSEQPKLDEKPDKVNEDSDSDDAHSATTSDASEFVISRTKPKQRELDSDDDSAVIKFSRSCQKIKSKLRRRLESSESEPSDDKQAVRKKQRGKRHRWKRIHKSSETEHSVESDEDGTTERTSDVGEESDEKSTRLDSDQSDQGKKGRRQIRKIKSKSALSLSTKTAEAEESERRRRIAERQKQYNDCVVQEDLGTEVVTKRLILEKKADGSTPLIEVHEDLLKHLKPHQVEAVRFLWDCVIESVERQSQQPSSDQQTCGAILAHCMGLGKTLSVIAFVHTLFAYPELLHIERCLVLCPVNTLLNWKNEWEMWLPAECSIEIFELVTKVDFRQRFDVLKHWHRRGGVMLLGYDMFRNLINARGPKARRKATKDAVNESLLNPGPDIVVCDEGHVLRNDKSGLSKAVTQIRTLKRIVLTGTPLQNNLNEYYAMVNFVKPNLLGTAKEFNNRFANPIRNGQHSNSTQRDVNVMKKRAHILYKTLDGCIQRKDYNCLTKYLPPRYEYVIMCRLTKAQRELYEAYLTNRGGRTMPASASGGEQPGMDRRNSLFHDQQTLYRIVLHPFLLRSHETREARKLLLEDDNDEQSTDESDTTEEEELSSSSSAESSVSCTEIEPPQVNARKMSKSQRVTRQQPNPATISDEDDEVLCLDPEPAKHSDAELQLDEPSAQPWWYKHYEEEFDWRVDVGCKLDALFHILKKSIDIGDKVLVFTQSLLALDLVEKFLGEIHRQWLVKQGTSKASPEDPQRPDLSQYFSDVGHNTWIRGRDYERLDGSTHAMARKDLQRRFNRSSNTRFRLLMISTKAGGLGINLISANRLIMLDASWNPSNDLQSIFRCYRFGQTKPVYIYRLIAQGTMEEKIYDRQVFKQSLSLRVIDERQIGRHFSNADLLALYSFDPDVWDPVAANQRPTPILPKDRLLADMISEYPHLISNYHEHDSLLEHREDEDLTEEERQEAWREYEEEKRLGISLAQYQQQELINQTQLQNARALQAQQLQYMLNQQQSLIQTSNAPYNPLRPPLQYRPVRPSSFTDLSYVNRIQAPYQRFLNAQSSFPAMFEKYRNHLLQTRPSMAANPTQLENAALSQVLEAIARDSQAKVRFPFNRAVQNEQPRPSQ